MNCPKCGTEVDENQKFCGSCGAKLEHIEDAGSEENISENTVSENIISDNQDAQNEEKNTYEDYGFEYGLVEWFANLNGMTKKIIIAVLYLVLIAGAVFGIMQYKQYQKDIEPISYNITFGIAGSTSLNAAYEASTHKAILTFVFKDLKVEDWQIQYFKEYYGATSSKCTLKKDNNTEPFDIKYINLYIEKDKSPEMKYYISDVNPKKFAIIKEVINPENSNVLSLEIPNFIYSDKKTREAEKKKYITWKKEKEAKEEAERKHKKWQEKVLSNCVYKTSDGVCFTTQVFYPDGIKDGGDKYKDYNGWNGAKDACESKGYKLPSDDDLRSLFQDILGIKIKSGVDIKSYKYKGTTEAPTNYNILKRIAPNGFNDSIYEQNKWQNIDLWEDADFDDKLAYARAKFVSWGDDETYQHLVEKYSYTNSNCLAICVYDPNGKPHKSKVQKQKEEQERAKKKQEAIHKEAQKETKIQNDAINDFMY